jgi:hypothetical protein
MPPPPASSAQQAPKHDLLAHGLGWASLGLGIPQVAMPGRFARAIGIKDDDAARRWTLVVGVREHLAAAGILAIDRRRPVPWLWARVAGDIMDLALLLSAWGKRRSTARLAGAIGAVIGIGATDLMEALRMTREPERVATPVREIQSAITVWRPRDVVERRWQTWSADSRANGEAAPEVRFLPTPDGRGTEIHLRAMSERPQAAFDVELLRFKQFVETGQVVRSEGSPDGPDLKDLMHQRPAQPIAATGGSER